MKIAYDTEFYEDGERIHPISIGMVAEDGRELYHVFAEVGETPLYDQIRHQSWLMEHVIPFLSLADIREHGYYLDWDDISVLPSWAIRNRVRQFIGMTPDPELWANYGAYDHVLLGRLFGPIVNWPEGFPMWTNDLRQELSRHGRPGQAPMQDPTTEHHALADARQVMQVLRWLDQETPNG